MIRLGGISAVLRAGASVVERLEALAVADAVSGACSDPRPAQIGDRLRRALALSDGTRRRDQRPVAGQIRVSNAALPSSTSVRRYPIFIHQQVTAATARGGEHRLIGLQQADSPGHQIVEVNDARRGQAQRTASKKL
jgi:hypothetical protein